MISSQSNSNGSPPPLPQQSLAPGLTAAAQLEALLSAAGNYLSAITREQVQRGQQYAQLQAQLRAVRGLMQAQLAQDKLANVGNLVPMYRAFWEGVQRLGDLPQRYRRLVDGLDERSVECISRLLGRVALFAAWDTRRPSFADVITADELHELQRQHKELEQQIVPLATDIFAWQRYLLPIREFRASVFLYRHQLHMLDHPEAFRDKDVIDAGACLCDSALILREYTSGRIYCFEAMSRHLALMRRTIELNALQDVIPVARALGAEQGSAVFHYAGGASTMMPDMPAFSGAGAAETVEVITLDSFTADLDCDIGLIKVDIEGAEQLFLAGARRTIERFRPVLLISIYHSPADFFDIKPLIASWDLGYTFKISRPPLVTGVHETLLICEAQP